MLILRSLSCSNLCAFGIEWGETICWMSSVFRLALSDWLAWLPSAELSRLLLHRKGNRYKLRGETQEFIMRVFFFVFVLLFTMPLQVRNWWGSNKDSDLEQFLSTSCGTGCQEIKYESPPPLFGPQFSSCWPSISIGNDISISTSTSISIRISIRICMPPHRRLLPSPDGLS